MRILVTGGAGFIGSNFVRYIFKSQPEWEVVVLDLLTYAGNKENLTDLFGNPRFHFYHGDIRDEKVVSSLMKNVEAVVNFAAESHVDRSILGAAEFISTNIHGTYILLEAAKKADLNRFIQISTDEVYGSCPIGKFLETDILNPSSPYSASKASADLIAISYYTTYKLPILITRSTNNYGPYQYPEKLIPLFITNALNDEPLPLYGDGQQRRDWLYVEDNCRGIEHVLLDGKPGTIYNIGAGTDITNLEIVEILLDLLGKPKSLIRNVADRPGHDRRYAVNIDRMQKLGWKTLVSLEDGLMRTVNWYLQNVSWWRSIKERQPSFQEFYKEYYNSRLL